MLLQMIWFSGSTCKPVAQRQMGSGRQGCIRWLKVLEMSSCRSTKSDALPSVQLSHNSFLAAGFLVAYKSLHQKTPHTSKASLSKLKQSMSKSPNWYQNNYNNSKTIIFSYFPPRNKLLSPASPASLANAVPTLAQGLQSLRQLTLPRLGDAQGIPGIAAVGHAPCQLKKVSSGKVWHLWHVKLTIIVYYIINWIISASHHWSHAHL